MPKPDMQGPGGRPVTSEHADVADEIPESVVEGLPESVLADPEKLDAALAIVRRAAEREGD